MVSIYWQEVGHFTLLFCSNSLQQEMNLSSSVTILQCIKGHKSDVTSCDFAPNFTLVTASRYVALFKYLMSLFNFFYGQNAPPLRDPFLIAHYFNSSLKCSILILNLQHALIYFQGSISFAARNLYFMSRVRNWLRWFFQR